MSRYMSPLYSMLPVGYSSLLSRILNASFVIRRKKLRRLGLLTGSMLLDLGPLVWRTRVKRTTDVLEGVDFGELGDALVGYGCLRAY